MSDLILVMRRKINACTAVVVVVVDAVDTVVFAVAVATEAWMLEMKTCLSKCKDVFDEESWMCWLMLLTLFYFLTETRLDELFVTVCGRRLKQANNSSFDWRFVKSGRLLGRLNW